jgi:AcrR family transcriptional regulator
MPIERTRPGGRSARIQQAVHQATRELLAAGGRDELGIPSIASRAGVNPTTIYRRWGDINGLLSDVATEELRPTEAPAETGSLEGDLLAWAEQLLEELGSDPGRALAVDLIAGDPGGVNAESCAQYTASTIQEILDRHAGPAAPTLDDVRDRVLAPIYYKVLFRRSEPAEDYPRRLVSALLAGR